MVRGKTSTGWFRGMLFALLALALVFAPYHGHGKVGADGTGQATIVFALDAGSHPPESQPEDSDHTAGQCIACVVIKQIVAAQHFAILVSVRRLAFRWVPAVGEIAASPADLFRPPIASAV